MDGAGDAGVERVDGAQDFEGFLGLDDRIANEGCLVRARDPLFVPRRGIPSGGDDGLVVVDLAVPDHHPVGEAASRGFVEADTLELAIGYLGGVGIGCVAPAEVGDELVEEFEG